MSSLVRTLPDQSTLAESHSFRSASGSVSSETQRLSQHHHTGSLGIAQSRSRRSLASLAKAKTSGALASLAHIGTSSNPSLRTSTSSGNLSKYAASPHSPRPTLPKSPTSPGDIPTVSQIQRRSGALLSDYDTADNIDSSRMAGVEKVNSRMHQTSSKVLRMRDDDRPFTRDFKDLFSTLITSLPLTPHRVRFTRVEETFLSEEAITNLGSLKFSQSNRIPDPKNPTRWVVTTTTTTFSMAKEMARSVCQRFVDARFIESAESKSQTQFLPRGAVWQLTPKGAAILTRFCARNGIVAAHVEPVIKRNQMKIVALERDPESDKILQDKSTVEIIFRRFMGQEGPNLKSTTSLSDSDSVSEYATGLVGVKMARERRIYDKIVHNTFTGKAASDWLMDCCTTIDRRETDNIAELFVKWQLITPVVEDRNYTRMNPMATYFQPTKNAIYTVTDRGQRLCGWIGRPPSVSSEDSREVKEKDKEKEKVRMPKDSNVNRLNAIIQDPALRLLFKEFLHMSLCQENLNFYLDVRDFTESYHQFQKAGKLDRPEFVREQLAAAYGLYNSFLASGAPSELNIDHSLRNRLDSRMIRTDSDDESMRLSLDEVVDLMELAQSSVFKLMASDSVPKFIRDPRYANVLRDHDFDVSGNARAFSPAPEPSIRRSNTSRT